MQWRSFGDSGSDCGFVETGTGDACGNGVAPSPNFSEQWQLLTPDYSTKILEFLLKKKENHREGGIGLPQCTSVLR